MIILLFKMNQQSFLILLLLLRRVLSFQLLRSKQHIHSWWKGFQSTKNSNWNIGDNWEQLSKNASYVDSSSFFNVDAASKAARDLEEFMKIDDRNEEILDEMFPIGYVDDDDNDDQDYTEDAFTQNIIDSIQTESLDPNGPCLYDTQRSMQKVKEAKSISFEDEIGQEISLLVRCNERPNTLLIDGGRALPALTDDQKYDISQLVLVKKRQQIIMLDLGNEADNNENSVEFEVTDFFMESVKTIFNWHAKQISVEEGKSINVLDSKGIASWLSKSLEESVGPHDKRVPLVLSKYGTYGSGILTENQFIRLYYDAVTMGLDKNDRVTEKHAVNLMKKMKMNVSNVDSVWRDFQNHHIDPPIVTVHAELQAKLDDEYGVYANPTMDTMDECEILEWKSHGQNSLLRPKSSHELVEFTRDRTAPKRIRDGSFVFIDEESCIGCSQCASIAPSSFKMLDSGRARTFSQSASAEVDIAVSTCPVSCMHYLAFHELKEMEIARDNGDGHKHHRHLNENAHTPLHIARRGSDMNHKSSWYHHLKQNCFKSKLCPQKGCYDCPLFEIPGANPYYKQMFALAERSRAKDIIETGEGDMYRKIAEL